MKLLVGLAALVLAMQGAVHAEQPGGRTWSCLAEATITGTADDDVLRGTGGNDGRHPRWMERNDRSSMRLSAMIDFLVDNPFLLLFPVLDVGHPHDELGLDPSEEIQASVERSLIGILRSIEHQRLVIP